tara:strand:- start:1054 stop:1320 length:267 start_codon:yes stop_codon:yes gene_type:complete
MRNDNRNNQNGNANQERINGQAQETTNTPDYIAMQYRMVRVESGWKTRKERIGVAFNNSSNNSICFRPSGQQVIEGDIYLFPYENNPA